MTLRGSGGVWDTNIDKISSRTVISQLSGHVTHICHEIEYYLGFYGIESKDT